MSPQALCRLAALVRATAAIDWDDELAAHMRWLRICRLAAALPAGDAVDRELAAFWRERGGYALFDELEAHGLVDEQRLAALDVASLPVPNRRPINTQRKDAP